jgi:YesN/AraC family two-component response regulator
MSKLLLLTFTLIVLLKAGYSQNLHVANAKNEEIILNFMQFSPQQLYDTANYFLFNNHVDTALICYGLIINTPVKKDDTQQYDIVINACIRIAHIFSTMCDYIHAYKYLIDALQISEKQHNEYMMPLIYNNLGNIYAHFYQYDMAKSYYYKALTLCKDTTSLDLVYNNLGYIDFFKGNRDSAFYFLNKSLQICTKYQRRNLSIALDSKGSLYQKSKQYDSAFYYYRLSLEEVKKSSIIDNRLTEAQTLSNIGNLFFEVDKTDSALCYLALSNSIAKDNKYLQILADNYLILSKIEELKGNIKSAFKHFKKHANLKDSVFNANIYGDINQLQRLYEVSKTNQQIEQLIVEQKIKEKTIHYQKMIWWVTLSILLLVSAGSIMFYIQKRNLRKAYKILFDKNIEIIELLESYPEKRNEKHRQVVLNDEKQNELVERILLIMEDPSIICDTDFTLAKLAVLLQSNHVYVSQVINSAFKKNFRLLLNGYRIKEAQKLFSGPDIAKYTIEYIANRVGFKSSNAFRHAFKDITGVTPGYYLSSMMKKQ